MDPSSALPVAIAKADAAGRIERHVGSWLVRLARRQHATLTAMELVYLPFWTYDFRAHRRASAALWAGCLAVETHRRSTAIVPATVTRIPPPESASLLPAAPPPPVDEVRRVLFWEALAHRRRERPDDVELEPPRLLYVPFWLGYLRGEGWDLCPVDATSGKIDLETVDALLHALQAADRPASC